MKYNINNLDQFREKINNPFETMINDIVNQEKDLIENKIKELIKPYVDLEGSNMLEIAEELAFKNLELKCITNGLSERYQLTNNKTREKDYFVINQTIIEKEENKEYKISSYISDIIRGIK